LRTLAEIPPSTLVEVLDFYHAIDIQVCFWKSRRPA
jgi:hypothetical protein